MTASSQWDVHHGAHRGRLNLRNVGGRGAWAARHNNAFQWFQMRLLESTRITAVATQGRYETNQWVKSYELAYSHNGVKFIFYKSRGKVKVRSPVTVRKFVT